VKGLLPKCTVLKIVVIGPSNTLFAGVRVGVYFSAQKTYELGQVRG